jgi:nitrite reductase/ring-hydroxylating ferredoxin subunit/uncharacterized membrane protein
LSEQPPITRLGVRMLSQALDRLIGRIERAAVLDRVSDRVAAAVATPLSWRRVRNILSGTSVGHPAHPALVTLPMGSWLAASYLDVFGGARSRPAAGQLVGFGTLSALPAMLTGLSDWSYTTGAERRVGFVHAAGNYAALSCYTASWVARRRRHHRVGTWLAAAGTVTVSLTGWLGGHLSYARGVGVDTTAFQVAPVEWTDVISESELFPNEPVLVHAAGHPVLLISSGGELVAIADRCTHRGAPLHEGPFDNDCIVCPWHGSTFAVSDGHVVEGPATRAQPVFEVRTRLGKVQVRRRDEPGSLRSNPVT